MPAGYVRQSTIANGNIGDASLWNSEYDALQAAFDASTGHNHDGTVGGGAAIASANVTYDDSVSNMGVSNAQDAIQLLDDRVDDIEGIVISGPVQSIDGQTGIVTLADINLDAVDNTADADKPISTAQASVNTTQDTNNTTQQTAIDTKITLARSYATALSF